MRMTMRMAMPGWDTPGDRGEKEENQEEENQEEENQENADVKKKVVVLSVENAANYLI
jgi:hypothetical protein